MAMTRLSSAALSMLACQCLGTCARVLALPQGPTGTGAAAGANVKLTDKLGCEGVMCGHVWVSLSLNSTLGPSSALGPMALERAFSALGVSNTWSDGRFQAVVPPAAWPTIQTTLRTSPGVRWRVEQRDMQEFINGEKTMRARHPYRHGRMAKDEFYQAWRTYAEINDYVATLRAMAPATIQIEDTTIGTTYEGRPIQGIKIWAPPAGNTSLVAGAEVPKIMMHGCHHSGEWITAHGMVYFIEQFLTRFGIDRDISNLLSRFQWIMVPVVNVDGYLFSWANDQYRTWRKTRSIHPANIEAKALCELGGGTNCEACLGTDPNRNWDDHWAEIGASDNPCSNSYHGPEPFSEVESLALARYVAELEGLEMYVDHHCCGDMYLQPYGWTDQLPPDFPAQDAMGLVGKLATDAVHGRNYRQGPIFTTIYGASGSSVDYHYTSNGVVLSFATEMRSSNGNGPADPVLPGSEEVFAGMKAMANQLLLNRGRTV